MDCRQELLDELGVDRTYTDMFGDFDNGYVYSSSKEYPLIVTTPRGDTFNIAPLPGDMETPAGVCRLLYDAWKGPQVILEAVRAEAPEYADILAENYSTPFTCTLNPNRTGSVTTSRKHKIDLGDSVSCVHEIMHLLVPVDHHIPEQWKYEACAMYFNYKFYQEALYIYKTAYYNWFATMDMYTPEYFKSESGYLRTQKVFEIYLAQADFPQDVDEVDVLLFEKALLVADYSFLSASEFDDTRESMAESYQSMGIGGLISEGGNELSYIEAVSFADYLIEGYSLSTFLEYCLDPDTTFEEAYGIDYETAEAAWLENLMGMKKD